MPLIVPPNTTRPRGGVSRRVLIALGLVVLVTLGGLGLSAVTVSGNDSDAPAKGQGGSGVDWFTVHPDSFDLTVIETGDLDAADAVEIKSRLEGKPQIIWLIDEGTEVKEGEVLVRIDDEAVVQKIEEARLNVQEARAAEVFARQELEIERNEAASVENAVRVAQQLAQLELAKWQKGDVPQMRRELQLALETAQRLVERTARDYELSRDLYEQKFISLNDLEDSEIARLEAGEGLKTTELALEVYNDYTFETEKQLKQSAVDQARADLEKQIARNKSSIERLEAQLASKVQTLQIRETKLKNLQDQLEATVIKAPKPGMVVYATSVGARNWRTVPMAEGREVRFNESLIVLPDLTRMVANLSVAEAYEPLVKLGQTVKITVDARPGRVYEGTVERLSMLSESGGYLNPNQREFTVRVSLAADVDPTLRPAMRCTGEINVGRVEDALAVPVQAVFAEGDTHYVHVPAGNGRVRRQTVEIGRASDSMVVVKEGLTDGDRILLRAPSPGELVGAS